MRQSKATSKLVREREKRSQKSDVTPENLSERVWFDKRPSKRFVDLSRLHMCTCPKQLQVPILVSILCQIASGRVCWSMIGLDLSYRPSTSLVGTVISADKLRFVIVSSWNFSMDDELRYLSPDPPTFWQSKRVWRGLRQILQEMESERCRQTSSNWMHLHVETGTYSPQYCGWTPYPCLTSRKIWHLTSCINISWLKS
jgi:hypothetical protein